MNNKLYDPESVNNLLGTLLEGQKHNAANINEISSSLTNLNDNITNLSVTDIIDFPTPHTAGSGVSISVTNEISIGQEVGITNDVQFNKVTGSNVISDMLTLRYDDSFPNGPTQFDIQIKDSSTIWPLNFGAPAITANSFTSHTSIWADFLSESGGNFTNLAGLVVSKPKWAQIRVHAVESMNIAAHTSYSVDHTYITITGASDSRIKSNEVQLENATTTLLKLNPVKYDLHPSLVTDEVSPDLTDVKIIKKAGFIAQEIENDCPELSYLVKDGNIKSVDYISLIPYIIKSLKEIETRITTLES